MTRLRLAKFNRSYENHLDLAPHYNEACENFLQDVMAWQAELGINFKIEFEQYYSSELMCEVSSVVAVFDDDTDLAMYKMRMPEELLATEVVPTSRGWEFSGWS